MIQLEGLKPDAAEKALADAGLTNVVPDKPETKKGCDGTIVAQTPLEGTTVKPNDKVTYTVCAAPDPVRVPNNLVGTSASSAESRLRELGLVPKIVRVDDAAKKDEVLEVAKAGDEVDPGTEITVKVSNAELVKVPDVENETFETAQALLEREGLIAEPVFVLVDGEPGTVIKQLTKAGKEVKRNSKVQLQVIQEVDPDPSISASAGTGEGGGEGE
jgi:beta-lactam-binding protein with PASTA domain